MVAWLTGLPRHGLSQSLDLIQNYCVAESLPPLTALVVQKGTGAPSSGYVATADAPSAQAKVYEHDWIGLGNPGPEALEAAPPLAG